MNQNIFVCVCFAFWFQHLRFSSHHFGKKRRAKGITTEDFPNYYMAGLCIPDWQGTKWIKNHPYHASKSQVWKQCELHCFFLSCSDNKLTRSTFSVTPSGGILLPSKAQDLLVPAEQKVQCSITQALQEHESSIVLHQQTKALVGTTASRWTAMKLPAFYLHHPLAS